MPRTMRVIRLEVEDSRADGVTRGLRPGFLGIFDAGYLHPTACDIPGPVTDDVLYPVFRTGEHFFALAEFDALIRDMERYKSHDPWWRSSFVAADYEVIPDAISEFQVIFRKETARFISAVPLSELIKEVA